VSGLHSVEGAPSLVPAWADPLNHQTWVLRLHETLGRRGIAQLNIADGWKVKLTGMTAEVPDDGDPANPWCTDGLQLSYGPYQVLSVAFTRS
jgi:alpha-mannosidase